MTPSWYDVLGVDPDASTEQIRTAWRAAVVDLDPGDRQFKLANKAAEVLLDPQRRAEHDAELADDVEDDEEVEEVEVTPVPPVTPVTQSAEAVAAAEPASVVTLAPTEPAPARPARGVPVWLAGVLAGLALLLVVVTVLGLVHTHGDDGSGGSGSSSLPSERDVADARAAAETAIAPVLSYDYRHLEADQQAAAAYLAPDYREKYQQYFAGAVLVNAPRTKTVVSVEVLDSAIVRTGHDLVNVLLFVNRPTTNKQHPASDPVVYHDQVTAHMQRVDGAWLIGCLDTQGEGSCED